jgi:hypothetical protein
MAAFIVQARFKIEDVTEYARLRVIVCALARERLLYVRLFRQLFRAGRLDRDLAQSPEIVHERVEQMDGCGRTRRCQDQPLAFLEQPGDERFVFCPTP